MYNKHAALYWKNNNKMGIKPNTYKNKVCPFFLGIILVISVVIIALFHLNKVL